MRISIWALGAVLGFGLMVLAYSSKPRPNAATPWALGLIAIGPEGGAHEPPPVEAIPTRLRFLPGSERVETMLEIIGRTARAQAAPLEAQLRPKLILLPTAGAGLSGNLLESGRLPAADSDEVIAGGDVAQRHRPEVAGRQLKVVGVLKPEVLLFADCYLMHASASADELFPEDDSSVRHATLVRLTPEQSRDGKLLQQLELAFPAPKYARLVPAARLDRRTYYMYLAGQALLLLAGSAALIGLYRRLAGRIGVPWMAAPFQEIDRRPRLVWAVHLAYFGLVLLGAAFIYALPDVQAVLMTAVRGQLASKTGPLGIAGQAYSSGSIPRAAAVTLLVNLVLGSIAVITLPSLIVPGIGILMAAVRALTWGLLLGPTSVLMAHAMLPHSWTMLLEGEAYVLAAFFALLIPIHLADRKHGGTVLARFGRVVLLNLQATLLVALVLAVSACYEATEVIWMASGALGV
jgi:hypothetical protein